MKYYATMEEELKEAAKAAKAEPANLVKKIQSLQEELKTLQSENEKLKAKLANQAAGDVDSQIKEIKGVKVLAMSVPEVDMNGLRNLGDQMKEKLGEGVVVLASSLGGKVSLLAMATEEAMSRGAHAGNLIKAIASQVGGGGGGRPNMAQAGGKNPDGINAAIEMAAKVLEEQLS
jgi:alanyl-tRNA synthetase